MLIKRPRSNAPRPSRRGTARALLTKALDMLIRQERPKATVTATELCQRAGVSRNSLYRYHSPILKVLHEHQRRGSKFRQAKTRKSAVRRRTENVGLRAEITKLAALVDHYYAAYRESTVTLERRDRELAELRGKLNSKPVSLTFAGRQ
jgi:hypothetical protein